MPSTSSCPSGLFAGASLSCALLAGLPVWNWLAGVLNHSVHVDAIAAGQAPALLLDAVLSRDAPTGVIGESSLIAAILMLLLSPLLADKDIDFEISTQPAPVAAHDWMLRELSRNLLHNAIRHTPAGGAISVRLVTDARHAALTIADGGPGIGAELRSRLFQPFSAGDVRSGSGLGLAICHEIVGALGGSISLDNREARGQVTGLDATVRLALAQNQP